MSKKILLVLGLGGIAAVVYAKRETVGNLGKLASFVVLARVNAYRNGSKVYRTPEGHYALGENSAVRHPDRTPVNRLQARVEIDRFVSGFLVNHPSDLPTYKEIAEALDMTPAKVKEIIADTGGL